MMTMRSTTVKKKQSIHGISESCNMLIKKLVRVITRAVQAEKWHFQRAKNAEKLYFRQAENTQQVETGQTGQKFGIIK